MALRLMPCSLVGPKNLAEVKSSLRCLLLCFLKITGLTKEAHPNTWLK